MNAEVVALADDLLLVLANEGRAGFLSALDDAVGNIRAAAKRVDHKPYWWMPGPPL